MDDEFMTVKHVFTHNTILGMMCALMMDERLTNHYYFPSEKRRAQQIYHVVKRVLTYLCANWEIGYGASYLSYKIIRERLSNAAKTFNQLFGVPEN